MPTYSEIGDKIIGDKIVCEARQIKTQAPINKSGRHKSQRVVLKDNAEATVLKKGKFLTKTPKK